MIDTKTIGFSVSTEKLEFFRRYAKETGEKSLTNFIIKALNLFVENEIFLGYISPISSSLLSINKMVDDERRLKTIFTFICPILLVKTIDYIVAKSFDFNSRAGFIKAALDLYCETNGIFVDAY